MYLISIVLSIYTANILIYTNIKLKVEDHVLVYSYEKIFAFFYNKYILLFNNFFLYIFFAATQIGGIVATSTMVQDIVSR